MGRKFIAIVAGFVTVVLASAGCTMTEQRDLEGAKLKDPDKYEIFANVNEHPNIVRLCIDHVAFLTTTRDQSPAAVMRVPEWDVSFCGASPAEPGG